MTSSLFANSSTAPVITIDGPVASGKGTVARALATKLGFHLLDSGAIYRSHALACMDRGIKINEINLLEIEAKALSLEFRDQTVWLDGRDATDLIRAEAVGMAASAISAIPEVRAALLERQRAFAAAPGLVADGRDMGTVVFPHAALKVYLTATAEVRGQRRSRQLDNAAPNAGSNANPNAALEQVISQIRQRDLQDKSRATAPLKPAADAVVLDNAGQDKHETVEAILRLWSLRSG
ncbi:MAG: (d)CMP kinase [Burkholderiales bacterium]|nr:MAG: (d)CMP kinase [Burkholderiales bacterium]